MERVLVEGHYINGGVYVLKHSNGLESGKIFKEILPNSIINFGNAKIGFLARQLVYNRQQVITLNKLSEIDLNRDVSSLKILYKKVNGFILWHGAKGWWAITEAAAEKGLFVLSKTLTKQNNGNNNQKKLMPQIKQVEKINVQSVRSGGSLCEHIQKCGESSYKFFTDGEYKLTNKGQLAKNHPLLAHRGCMESPNLFSVTGGTYLVEIRIKKIQDKIQKQITALLVSPIANLEEVKNIVIKNLE